MLGLLSGRTAIFGVATVGVAVFIGLGYLHYSSLVDVKAKQAAEIAALQAQVDAERARVAQAAELVERFVAEQRRSAQALEQLETARRAASAEGRRLNSVLGRHDLQSLAGQRPDAVERLANDASARMLRLLEQASGAGRGAPAAADPADAAGAGAGQPSPR